ncbi:type II secretion system F family protein [Saccharopolyspora hattusasensis]|uniref:type II secretion system F family protein n=1 Tax=Saccharopolyspora hattusasensis TaxID=1128679 RepID=UPI003D999877
MISTFSVLCGLALGAGLVLGLFTCAAPPRLGWRPAGRFWVSVWRRVRRWWRRGLLATAVACGVWWVSGWPVAGLAAVAAVVGVPVLLAPAGPRDAIALQDALAVWTRRVGDLLASGAGGLHQALARSADTAPEPLTGALQRLADRLPGDGPERALRVFADELADPAVDEVVLALLLRVRSGGRGLVENLHALAAALNTRVAAQREIEADRAKPRTTVRTLVAITAVMAGGLLVFAHPYLAPFSTWEGQAVLAGVVGIFAGALWRMHRLSTTPPRSRYLGSRP